MSITFIIKRQGIVDTIGIPGSEISAFLLQKLLAEKLKTREQDITLFNTFTGLKINPIQIIKDKSIVDLERLFKSQNKLCIAGIVSNQQLLQMGKKGRFFMIKSSNQQNIQKAREFSVWATTSANQDKLRSALLYSPHVFLLFATNRSYQIKGLARMQKQPGKAPQKAFWSGVSNIRLGGNFQIRWIRKHPLTSIQIDKALGSQIKDRIMRLSDGEQIDGDLAIKILPLFQLPAQPYYTVKQQESKNKTLQIQKKVPSLGQILGNGIQNGLNFPTPIVETYAVQNLPEKKSQIIVQLQKQQNKKEKQNKNKKKKKDRRRESSSDSQNSSSSNSSSSSSDRSRSSPKKKIKKEKKNKKKQSKRSRSRSRSRSERKKKRSKKDKDKKKKKRNKN